MSDCGTKNKSTSEVLCNPRDVAVDAAGSIYFCDLTAVRKVTYSTVAPSAAVTLAPSMTSAPVTSITAPPTATTPIAIPRPRASSGILSTIAGSELKNENRGIAVDTAGNLFVSKFQGLVLKVTASTGTITVLAGREGANSFSGDGGLATSATLHYPSGIALDKFGNIFVSDARYYRVRKITVSTGIITTVAGSVSAMYWDFVEPVDNIAATSSTLHWPGTIAIDSVGNLYISDVRSGRVRKVTASTGIITTIAGSKRIFTLENPSAALGVAATATKFLWMGGVAVDSSDNVYFASSDYNSIFMIPASTGLLTLVAGNNTCNVGFNGDDIPATTAYLNGPSVVSVDALGNIFFIDAFARIRKVAAGTGIITTVVGKSSAYFPGCYIRGNPYKSDGKNATAVPMCLIEFVAVDMAGSLYFIASGGVRKVTYSGTSSSSGRQVSSTTHITPFSFSSAIHSTIFFFSPLFITLLYLY